VGNLTEARGNISEAFAALRLIGGWTSSWRVESFLMGIRKSVERTRELLERAEKQGLDVSDLKAELVNVEVLIDEAGDLREEKDIKGAVEKLKEIREILRDIHQELAELRKGGPKGG
jgi:ATP phosphoribosyltransferase regulatory subunit HisZ